MKIILKLTLAIGILYWLSSNGRLDLNLVLDVLKYPELLAATMALLILQVSVCAFRWLIILRMKNPSIPFKKIYSLQWIGQLFSAILPGGVAGDLVKIGHLIHDYKGISKAHLLYTIFVDRFIGLCALLFISSLSGLLYLKELIAFNSIFKEIIFINTILFLASLCFLIFLFFKLPPKKILQMLGLSLLAHLFGITAFITINLYYLNPHIDLKLLFSLIPIGQASAALPISPGGLGVGHIVFDKLFSFIHQDHGASLFNLAWVMIFCTNLLGLIPFILKKSHRSGTL